MIAICTNIEQLYLPLYISSRQTGVHRHHVNSFSSMPAIAREPVIQAQHHTQ